MDDKTKPNSLYITRKDNNNLDENIGNLDDVRNDNPQWGKDVVVSELMNLGNIDVHDVETIILMEYESKD